MSDPCAMIPPSGRMSASSVESPALAPPSSGWALRMSGGAMTWHGSDRRSRLPGDWATRRRRVLKRDGYLCQLAGPNCTRLATEVDHIGDREDHAMSSLRAVCHACHSERTSQQAIDSRRSIAMRRNRPEEIHPGLIE